MPGLTTADVLHLLQEVAAELITPRFRALLEGQIFEKRPGDLVTVADREAEVAITTALTTAYPSAVVLGEEAYAADPTLMDRYLAAQHAFTVDPVDGTKNFVGGSPDHAVMASEVIDGVVTRAWVWQPEHRVAWTAERGGGTARNGAPVRVNPTNKEHDLVGATSIWDLRGTRVGSLPPLRLTWVCCGIDYPRLVEGEADYILYSRAHPWDHAPGSLLLSEAGGHLGFRDGTDYDPRRREPGLIAAASREVFHSVASLLTPPPPA